MGGNMSKYSTQNLYEAAYLMAKGCNISGKDSSNKKITLFFDDKDAVEKMSFDFYNGGEIPARKYSDSYRTLKDYVFMR